MEAETEEQQTLERVSKALLDFLIPGQAGLGEISVPTYTLLSGPPRSGKTSLLLQLAYNLALEGSSDVVFLCKTQNFENNYTFLCQDVDISSYVFNRIHIKYIKKSEEIRKYFAAFHLYQELPAAVIIDDFVDFFGLQNKAWEHGGQTRSRELEMVNTLGLCHSAIKYANEKTTCNKTCRLVVSDSHPGDGPRFVYILRRWLPQIIVTKVLISGSSFTLSAWNDGCNKKMDVIAKYSTIQQFLLYDGLEYVAT